MREAAVRIAALGPRAVVIKGGHLPGAPIDVVFADGQFTELKGDRLAGPHTHGTGCTFSAALTARLALGDDVIVAARAAKEYVAGAILRAPGLGHGQGPLGHF
jgi:hydroxymethylpyrimidine/phosphomethylpyrimidine kinase